MDAWLCRQLERSVGFSDTIGSYFVYASDSRDEVAVRVTVSRKEVKGSAGLHLSDHGDVSGACFVQHKFSNERRFTEAKRQVECTLGALAALGVEIEREAPGRAQ